MRFLTMLLMLCLSLLSAADAQLKCDRSLIKGVTNEQIQFDDDSKTLTCVEKGNSFMMIHFPDIDKYKSIPYVSLKCDIVGGWKARMPKYGQNDDFNYEVHTIADASSVVNIECVEYCGWYDNSDIVMEKIVSSGLPTIVLKPAQGCRLLYEKIRVVERAECTPYKGQYGKIGWTDQKGESLENVVTYRIPFKTKCYNDGQKICDRSLIKEVANAQITFDVKTKTLSCTGTAHSLMSIYILSQDNGGTRSKPYASLECDDFGWCAAFGHTSGMDYDTKIADASALLKIDCVEYCAFTGTGFHVIISSGSSYITLKFKEFNSRCGIYHEQKNIGTLAHCNPYAKGQKGWFNEQESKRLITKQIDRPQHFDVRCIGDPLISCTVEVSHRQHHLAVNMDISTKTATCRRTSDYALAGIIAKNIRFGTLQCEETNGWKAQSRLEGSRLINQEYKVAEASATLDVECIEYCQATGDGIQFNQIGEGAEVTCATDFKLHHANQALSKATCDLSGEWTLEKANSEKTKDKSGSFECRPTKCYMPSIEGGRFDKATKILTCDSNGNALIAIQVNSELFTSVSCDIVGGWSGVTSSGKNKFAEASAQLDAKCVKYCTPGEQSDQVQSVSGQAHSTQFTCNGNNAEALEIRLNDKFVTPPLECHMDRGYTDASGVRLAGPLDTVKLDCAIRPAPTTTTSSQQLLTSTMISNDDTTTTHGSKIDEAEAQSSVTVVCASIGGVLLLIIAIVVIVIVLKKKRPENNSERPKAGSKEKHRKGNEKSGGDQNSSGQ